MLQENVAATCSWEQKSPVVHTKGHVAGTCGRTKSQLVRAGQNVAETWLPVCGDTM